MSRPPVLTALAALAAPAAQAWAAFDLAKTACQSCHQAEPVDYMNNQPVFDLKAPAVQASKAAVATPTSGTQQGGT